MISTSTAAISGEWSGVSRLRIGLNALFWRPDGMGGTQTYLLELLGALLTGDSADEFVVFLGTEAAEQFPIKSSRITGAWVPGSVQRRSRFDRTLIRGQTLFGEEAGMRKSRFTPEQVLQALRQSEAVTVVAEICRKLGVTMRTFYRWKKQDAGLCVGELRELR